MHGISRSISMSFVVYLTSWAALADTNSFTTTIQNNAMLGGSLTKQMINLGGTPTTGGGRFSPANCMPPVDLQRGSDGHVPSALQGDPRYQEYLRCKQGIPPGQQGVPDPAAAVQLRAGHLPITATDFVPTSPGHPIVDRAISEMAITPEERRQVHGAVDEMFRRIASQYRGNNLSVSVGAAYATAMATLNGVQMTQQQGLELIRSVNDQLAQSPSFALMSPQQKQDESDTLIYQTAIILLLTNSGAGHPLPQQQAEELSRAVLRQLGNDGLVSVPSQHKLVLGVRVGPLSRAVAAAAGISGTDGALVIEVTPGSAAGSAGIKPGDILVHLGDHDIKTAPDVPNAMGFISPGEEIAVRVVRQGMPSDITVAF